MTSTSDPSQRLVDFLIPLAAGANLIWKNKNLSVVQKARKPVFYIKIHLEAPLGCSCRLNLLEHCKHYSAGNHAKCHEDSPVGPKRDIHPEESGN